MDAEIVERRLKRSLKDLILDQGDAAFNDGKYIDAGEKYITAVEQYGARPIPIYVEVASCYNKLKKYLQPVEVATVALEYDPRSVDARYERATARKYFEQPQGRVERFAQIVYYKDDIESTATEFSRILAQDPARDDVQREIQLLQSAMVHDEGFTMDKFEEEHPLYTDKPWEINENLDNEEPAGDKKYGSKPCPACNHGSCEHGGKCELRHGHDNRSVRDEFGRNVCAEFLMGDCQDKEDEPAQDKNCPYSHCSKYLSPRGWWTSQHGIEAAKYLKGYLYWNVEYEDLYAAVQRMPEASNYVWSALKADMIPYFFNQFQDSRPYKKLDYADREPTYDWSSDEEKYMGPMMERLFPALLDGCDQTPPERPFVLVVAFEHFEEDEDRLNRSLYKLLELTITTVHPRKYTGSVEMILRYLDSPNLIGVLVTDPELFAKREHTLLMPKLLDYVKKGGSLRCGRRHSKPFGSRDL